MCDLIYSRMWSGFEEVRRGRIWRGLLEAQTLKAPIKGITTVRSALTDISDLHRLPWKVEATTGPQKGIPLWLFLNRREESLFSIGLLEQDKVLKFTAVLNEAEACYDIELRLPKPEVVHIYMTRDPRPWNEVVYEYGNEIRLLTGLPEPLFPEGSFDPTYCTWYSIHHQVNQEWCIKEGEQASNCGLKTFIIDDGWFFDGTVPFGDYSFTGDWEPASSKFPDLKGFVEAMHRRHTRVLLWIAPFMVGVRSKAWTRFQEKLHGNPEQGVMHLSPTDPEARDYILSVFSRLLSDYTLDGFKIDFIDSIPVYEPEVADGLMQFYDGLRKMAPEALIEFRQYYSNYFSRRIAPMCRAVDAPFDPDANLWRCILLKTFSPLSPVHTDYLTWHPEEPLENIARALMAGIFFIPTISVPLSSLKPDVKNLMKRWLTFREGHKELLEGGEFFVTGKNIQVRNGVRAIYGLFESPLLTIPETVFEAWILNATPHSYLHLDTSEIFDVEVFNRHGALRQKGITEHYLEIEEGGYAHLTR